MAQLLDASLTRIGVPFLVDPGGDFEARPTVASYHRLRPARNRPRWGEE